MLYCFVWYSILFDSIYGLPVSPHGTWSSSSAMHSLAPKLAAMLICPMALAAHSTGVCCKIRSWRTSCEKSELVVGTNGSTPNLPPVPSP